MAKSPAPKKPKPRQGLKADYRGASPEQVAEAVLRFRPQRPAKAAQKAEA